MKTSTKIAIGVIAGVGAYMLFFRPKKAKTTTTDSNDTGALSAVAEPSTKDEKIQYILENVEANEVENKSGFDGVKMTWNPKLGKMYPIGTLNVEEMPDYAQALFSNAEGSKDENPVEIAYNQLNKLSDKEIELAYLVTKFRKDNPKAISEADALKEMGADEKSKALLIIKSKVTPVLNEVKILKKTPNWKKYIPIFAMGRAGKNFMKNRKESKEFKSVCGKRPLMRKNRDAWQKCVDREKNERSEQRVEKQRIEKHSSKRLGRIGGGANPRAMAHAQKKSSFLGNLDSGVMTKAEINDMRQKGFVDQVVNRTDAGMFGGRRWDGLNYDQVENAYLPK